MRVSPDKPQTKLSATWKTVTWKELYPAIRDDIFEFCYWMGFNPTPQQRKLLQAVQEGHLRIACKSGQGPGKTTISTLIGLWWTLRNMDSTTMVTAPSMNLAKTVWLAECRRRMEKAHPLIKRFVTVTKSEVHIGGKKHPNWKIIIRTASSAEGIQGQHHDNLNLIIEEASGMEDEIIEALLGTVTNVKSEYTPDAEDACILMIGNPTRVDCYFYKCFTSERERWYGLTFNAEESPIVNKDKIAADEREFGRESNYFRVRVLGEFPLMDSRGVINPEDLEACLIQNTGLNVHEASRMSRGIQQWGIDLARQGGDETVAYRRKGNVVTENKIWPKTPGFEPAHAIKWCFRRQAELNWKNADTVYCFDSNGIGQGVIHLFDDLQKEYFGFLGHSNAQNQRKFADKLTEAWFQFARLVKARKVILPDDRVLFRQLIDRHYDIDIKGRLEVESKKEYCKRTKKTSPDRADALVMAFYETGLESQIARK